MSVNEYLNSFN
jgi:hypothetical protein